MTALDNYVAPTSLEQAVVQLQELGEVTILAGGTDLMPQSHAGRVKFKRTLMNIRRIPELRRGLGMVFQDHRLLMDRSVYDNVALPLIIAGLSREEIAKRVRAALDKVGLLERERSAPITLSTGEQQRVGIARAIVAKPAVLIADEPTGNLDPQLSGEIMQLFADFQQVGTTVLIASHDLPLVKRMGKRVLVLDHGRLLDDWRPGGGA